MNTDVKIFSFYVSILLIADFVCFVLYYVRKYLNESKESKTQACQARREQSDFIEHLCHFFDMDIGGREEPRDLLLSKVHDYRIMLYAD